MTKGLIHYHIFKILFIWICICLGFVATRAASYPPPWQKMSSKHLNEIASAYMSNDQVDSALACYSLVANRLNESERDERTECIKASFWLGTLQMKFYNYSKAVDCLLMAKQAATEINDSSLLSLIYHQLGILYVQYESSN